MRALSWIILPLFLTAPALAAALALATPQEEDAQLAEFAAIEGELQARSDELAAAIKTSDSVRERGRRRRERKALAGEYYARFFALAEAGNPHALLWAIQNAKASGREKSALPELKLELYGQAVERHASEAIFLTFFDELVGERKALGVPSIERIALRGFEANASADVRARILFGLGQLLARAKEQAERERGIAYFERLEREFGDSTWTERAAGDLFELKRLQTGMVAPEIEGSDLDGVEFKLSDYRGKVVMLDFWGDW